MPVYGKHKVKLVEKASFEVKTKDEFIEFIGEGGILAITMEPDVSLPTGVARGRVIAPGKLQSC